MVDAYGYEKFLLEVQPKRREIERIKPCDVDGIIAYRTHPFYKLDNEYDGIMKTVRISPQTSNPTPLTLPVSQGDILNQISLNEFPGESAQDIPEFLNFDFINENPPATRKESDPIPSRSLYHIPFKSTKQKTVTIPDGGEFDDGTNTDSDTVSSVIDIVAESVSSSQIMLEDMDEEVDSSGAERSGVNAAIPSISSETISSVPPSRRREVVSSVPSSRRNIPEPVPSIQDLKIKLKKIDMDIINYEIHQKRLALAILNLQHQRVETVFQLSNII